MWNTHLQDVPVDDGSPGVVNHLRPMLLLQLFPVVPEEDLADGVGASDAIVIQYCDLQIDLAQHT